MVCHFDFTYYTHSIDLKLNIWNHFSFQNLDSLVDGAVWAAKTLSNRYEPNDHDDPPVPDYEVSSEMFVFLFQMKFNFLYITEKTNGSLRWLDSTESKID